MKNDEQSVSDDFLLAYYEHQYDRIGKLEQSRLAITNIVVTLSVLVFTFGFDSDKSRTLESSLVLPIIIIAANLFAVAYMVRTSSWIATARLRAKRVLEEYAEELHELDKTTYAPHRKRSLARWKIQLLLHVLLIIAGCVPIAQYFGLIF